MNYSSTLQHTPAPAMCTRTLAEGVHRGSLTIRTTLTHFRIINNTATHFTSPRKDGRLSQHCRHRGSIPETLDYKFSDDSNEISSEDGSDEELNTHIGNTNWCTCGNCSKVETSTESLCCLEMLYVSDKIFNAIYSYVYSFLA